MTKYTVTLILLPLQQEFPITTVEKDFLIPPQEGHILKIYHTEYKIAEIQHLLDEDKVVVFADEFRRDLNI